MYDEAEDASDVQEDFFNALALLHSTEDNSTEKLQKMLDTFIEKKYGFDKTLMARLPKKFLQSTKIRRKSFSIEKSEKPEDVLPLKTESNLRKDTDLSFNINNSTENNWNSVKVFNTDVEDYSDKGDIPRISIPDEGSGDGLLCKVCNGAKLGPLILLECQECQEVYHPLCHQPPVVDIDVYDPRIVWRCKRCIDTSMFSDFDERKSRKTFINPIDIDKVQETDKLEELDSIVSKNETTVAVQTLFDCIVEDASIARNCSSQKVKRNVPSSQLRKRIGSKLSVTRSAVKQ